MHELRGAPEPGARRAGAADDARSICCWSRASSTTRIRRSKSTARRSASRHLHPDDPFIVAVASDEELPGLPLPWLPLDDAGGDRRLHPAPRRACAMAQLSDDCFAFGGDAAERRRGARPDRRARRRRSSRARRCRSPQAAGRILAARPRRRRWTCRRTPTARSTATPSPTPICCPIATPCCRSAAAPRPAIRSTARSGAARRSASSPARRCPRAPTP